MDTLPYNFSVWKALEHFVQAKAHIVHIRKCLAEAGVRVLATLHSSLHLPTKVREQSKR